MRKLSEHSVRAAIEAEGWAIADKEWIYVNNRAKIPLICPNGHKADKRFDEFRRGNRCAVCCGNNPHTTKFVKEFVKQYGWAIVDPKWVYTNTEVPIPLLCPNGHRADKIFRSFQRGDRCSICSGTRKKSTESVKEVIEGEGWIIADPNWTYKKGHATIPLLCPNGHRADKSFTDFRHGKRCTICYFGNPTLLAIQQGEAYALHRIANYIKQRCNRQGLSFNRTEAIAYLKKYLHPGALKIYAKSYKGAHIDHIVPASWFDLTKECELHACFDPGNLQVISASENLRKNSRLTLAEAQKLSARPLWALSHASYRPRSKEWDELAECGSAACSFLNS